MSPRVPVAAVIAVALHTLSLALRQFLPYEILRKTEWSLMASGIAVAATLMLVMAMSELALRLPPERARGARMAAFGLGVILAFSLLDGVIRYLGYAGGTERMWLFTIESYVQTAAYVAIGIGMVIAAGKHAAVPVLVIGLVLIGLPEQLERPIYKSLGESARYLYIIGRLAYLGGLLALMHRAATFSDRVVPDEPTAPIDQLGGALRARLTAMVIAALLMFMAIAGRSLGAIKASVVISLLVNLVAFVLFAIAALRLSRLADRGNAIALVCAGAAAAWCAGVQSVQMMVIFMLFSNRRNADFLDNAGLEVTQPLVAAASVVIALIAVANIARARGHADVADYVTPRAGWFVALMLGSMAIQMKLLPEVRTENGFIILTLLAAGVGVGALVVASGAFRRVAVTVGEGALPTAKLVE